MLQENARRVASRSIKMVFEFHEQARRLASREERIESVASRACRNHGGSKERSIKSVLGLRV